MTKTEAEARCKQLAAEHPDRESCHWITVKDEDGSWAVAKIGLPPPNAQATATSAADERPPIPDDPRTTAPHIPQSYWLA